MNFNEKLMELRKSSGLSQEAFGQKIGVSRQTVSKWELGQSYPDFQRLVQISDFFGLSLDALVKDVDVQEVREKQASQLSSLYEDVQKAKKAANLVLNTFAIIGVVGILVLLAIILLWG